MPPTGAIDGQNNADQRSGRSRRRRIAATLWRVNALAVVAFAVITMARPLFSVFADQELGANPTWLGIIAGSYALVPLFLSLPVGGMIHRWGERPLLLAGTTGLALGLLLASASPSLWTLALAALVTGMSQMLLVVCTQTLVTSLGDPREREHHLGLFTTATSAGQLLGPLGGGALADAIGFRGTFIAGAVVALAGVALARDVEPPPVAGQAISLRGQMRRARQLLRLPPMRLAILTAFSLIFTLGVHQSFYPVYVTRVLGLSATTLGVLLAIRAVFALAVRLYMQPLIDTVGSRYRVLLMSLICGALALGATPLLRDPWSLALAAALLGIATGLTMPLSMLAAANAVPVAERGLAMGVRLTGNRLAELTSPLLFGPLADAVGLAPAFYAAGILLLAAALLSLSWRDGLDEADEPVRAAAPGRLDAARGDVPREASGRPAGAMAGLARRTGAGTPYCGDRPGPHGNGTTTVPR
ncbi:MAG TPA: MFS transporter [Thermaerobacter sp.]